MKPYKQTSKLFFDKYVNKISITNALAAEFRSKSLVRAESQIRAIASQIENSPDGRIKLKSWYVKHVTVADIIYVTKLIDILRNETDFCLRVESDVLGIYSNDDSLIERIYQLGNVRDMSKPADDKIRAFLLATPNAIISKKYTHKYRVTVNPLRDASDSFHSWAEKLPSIKLLKRTYRSEGYFYAANDKTLGMCKIFLGNKIRRVDEMFLVSEI
jgi:hypothetical protein